MRSRGCRVLTGPAGTAATYKNDFLGGTNEINTDRFNCMIQVFLALLGIACASPAQAAYNYTSIDYPNADNFHSGSSAIFGIINQ